MKIQVKISENNFSPSEQESMWEIYKHYYHYSKAYFMDRLTKQHQFVVFYQGEKLVGFTGIKIQKVKIAGRTRRLIYYGQTVLDPRVRGKSLLAASGFKLCLKYWKDLLLGRICFWCDALSYKSYLLFAKSVESCYPSYQAPTPKAIDHVIQYIGNENYKDTFCAATGTVQKPENYINDPSVLVQPADKNDPDINFYVRQNPGYQVGHGLITVAPIGYKDILMLAGRFLSKGIRRRKPAGQIRPIPVRRKKAPAA